MYKSDCQEILRVRGDGRVQESLFPDTIEEFHMNFDRVHKTSASPSQKAQQGKGKWAVDGFC